MPALIRSELLALRTVRTTWLILAAALLLTTVLAVRPVHGAGRAGAPSIGTAGALLDVLGALAPGALAMLVLGVLAVTADFRHATVTPLLIRTPQRGRVMAARATAVALVAAAAAVAHLAVTLTAGVSGGAVRPSLLNADIILRVLGLLLTYPLYGLAGVAVGALIIHQPVAVLLPPAWLLVLEDLAVRLLAPAAAPWSVSGVSAALANAGDVVDVLPVAAGAAVLLAYTLLLLALGAVRVTFRDII